MYNMKHFSEQEIELIVTGHPSTVAYKQQFDDHIQHCHGCRQLFIEIGEFYQLKNSQQKQIGDGINSITLSIAPVIGRRKLLFFGNQNSIPSKIIRFTKAHQVASSVMLLALIILSSLILNQQEDISKENPTKYIINPLKRSVELYSLGNKLLWNIIVTNNLQGFKGNKDDYNNEYVRIFDLDNDGKNEIITTFRTENDQKENAVVLSIYDQVGALKVRKSLGVQLVYYDRQYQNNFSAKGLIVADFDNDGKGEIYVGVANRNSPYYLQKLDFQGNEIGQYRMYGHAFGIDTLKINGNRFIALMGINDDGETRTPLLTILDPVLIEKITRGTLFNGYSDPVSNAELLIAEFPRTDVEMVLNISNSRVTRIVNQSDSGFAICVGMPYSDGFIWGLADYYFTEDLRIEKVMFIDGGRKIHQDLQKHGKLSSQWDERYAQELKQRVIVYERKNATQ